MRKMADGGEVAPDKESAIITYLRNYMMGHGGDAGEDIRNTQQAMNVEPSTDTVKGMADGGEVTDDFDVNGGGSDTLKGLPLPANAIPVSDNVEEGNFGEGDSTFGGPPPEDGKESNDTTSEKVASSHPGTQPDELTPYLKQIESQTDRFGPEQEAQVMNALRQGYKKPGFVASEGLAGLGDAIMQGVARAGQGNALNTVERNKEQALTQAPEEMKQLREGNLQNIKEKMALEGMSGATPLGASQAGPAMFLVKQMFPDMSAADQSKMAQNPSALQAMLPQGVSLKEALARIQETAAYQKGMLENTAAGRLQQGEEFAAANPLKSFIAGFKPGNKSTQVASNFNHSSIPSGTVYKAPDGTMRRKK